MENLVNQTGDGESSYLDKIRQEYLAAADRYPGPALTRKQFADLFGMSEGRIANLDSLGEGIPDRFYQGRKVMYLKLACVDWFMQRVRRA